MDIPFTGPAPLFFTIAVVILFAPLAAERLRLPGIVGLIVAGILVGEEGFGLLARPGAVEQLGGLGLLYLMFLAGLELDLDALLVERRRPVIFGLLTFVFPMTLGTSSALLLGFGTLASLLIGSLWASHTLVAYPVIRRAGVVADPSVATTVGATVLTDTLALIVLAVVTRVFEEGGGWTFVPTIILGIAILGAAVLWLLPRLAEWFFSGIGPDRTLRFLFILAGLCGAAVLAEVVGIEGIVGAFGAGLALNRLVPNGGALMQRVEFVGSAILIPIFLVSVGMLVDVAVVTDLDTLWLAVAFIAVAMAGKWLAAEIAGRVFGFARAQIGVMFALSNGQAAATLAATIVGFELGLFDDRVVNAVLLVILVTVTVSSWVAARSVARIDIRTPTAARLGSLVLVAVADPDVARTTIRLGESIAKSDAGRVVPLHVVTGASGSQDLNTAHALMDTVVESSARAGADIDAVVRVDRSVAAGVINSVVERNASLVLVGWRAGATAKEKLLGTLLNDIVDGSPSAVAACWVARTEFKRIVLVLPAEAAPAELATAAAIGRGVARGGSLPMIMLGETPSGAVDGSWRWIGAETDPAEVVRHLVPGDLVVLPAGRHESIVRSFAPLLVDGTIPVGFMAVYPPTPTFDVGVPAIFAGG